MNVLVLNGSPKGDFSVSLQTAKFIEKHFGASFDYLNVGQQIKLLEKDFSRACEKIIKADLLLFVYPVYTFIAPSQLHRFIELLKDSGIDLKGKIATQITTSKHFYDLTAHAYVEENCYDLGLSVIDGLSADMDDLLTEKGRKEALTFWNVVEYSVKNKYFKQPKCLENKSSHEMKIYQPTLSEVDKSDKFQAVIVTDAANNDENLINMINDFVKVFPYKAKIVNINELRMDGGCLGCFKCASSGKCVYKDGYDVFLREQIQSYSTIIYAFTIKDHSMGSCFKMFDDRQFCNGHRTVTMDSPTAYIVSGDLDREENLRLIINGRSQVGGNYLAGIANDQGDTASSIKTMSDKLQFALENKVILPKNFLGVGGTKIFRDLIYQMQGLMRADHKFYKKRGFYDDFPQKKGGLILKMKLVGALMSNPKVMKKMGNKMNQAIIAPYRKVVENEASIDPIDLK